MQMGLPVSVASVQIVPGPQGLGVQRSGISVIRHYNLESSKESVFIGIVDLRKVAPAQ